MSEAQLPKLLGVFPSLMISACIDRQSHDTCIARPYEYVLGADKAIQLFSAVKSLHAIVF